MIIIAHIHKPSRSLTIFSHLSIENKPYLSEKQIWNSADYSRDNTTMAQCLKLFLTGYEILQIRIQAASEQKQLARKF